MPHPDSAAARLRFRVGILWFVTALLLLTALYVGLRAYQHAYGLSAGLESTDPLFQQYWMPLLWAELIGLFGLALGVQLYLIFTRDRKVESVAPEVELNRYFYLVMWMALYAFTCPRNGNRSCTVRAAMEEPIASASTTSTMKGRSLASNASRGAARWAQLRRAGRVTSRSRSEKGRARPLARDPKTQTSACAMTRSRMSHTVRRWPSVSVGRAAASAAKAALHGGQ